MTRQEIAGVLKSLREAAGMTQREVAEKTGKRQQTVASWETSQSQPDVDMLFKLCSLYGVTVNSAFGFFDDDPSSTQAITPEETKLLIRFRKLSPAAQASILQMMDVLIDNSSEKKL